MNRSAFAERVRKWQKELNDLLRIAEKSDDLNAAQIFRKYQPIFQTFVESLEASHLVEGTISQKQSPPLQNELWLSEAHHSNIHQLVDRIAQKISQLSLPKLSTSLRKRD